MDEPRFQVCNRCIGIGAHYHKADGTPVMTAYNILMKEQEKYPANNENALWRTVVKGLRFERSWK